MTYCLTNCALVHTLLFTLRHSPGMASSCCKIIHYMILSCNCAKKSHLCDKAEWYFLIHGRNKLWSIKVTVCTKRFYCLDVYFWYEFKKNKKHQNIMNISSGCWSVTQKSVTLFYYGFKMSPNTHNLSNTEHTLYTLSSPAFEEILCVH